MAHVNTIGLHMVYQLGMCIGPVRADRGEAEKRMRFAVTDIGLRAPQGSATANKHICIHVYIYIHAYYMHTYIHMYMHKYIHKYIYITI